MTRRILLKLCALVAAASALRAPVRPAAKPAPSPVARYTTETFRKPTALNIFGNKKREEEAEAARLDAEQEALNQRWAQESQNELVATSASAAARRAIASDRARSAGPFPARRHSTSSAKCDRRRRRLSRGPSLK